jgi:HK97 family phage prohead protease
MPSPKPSEDRDAFLERCQLDLLESGEEDHPDVAESICGDIWDQAQKLAKPIHHKTRANAGTGLDFVLSDGSVDRMGDIVSPDGWDIRQFQRNPVALFAHRHDFPIGTWKDVRVEQDELRGRLQLAPLGTSDRIDEVIRLVRADVLRAVSVGFIGQQSKPRGEGIRGQVFTKQTLVEVSLVSIPANENSLRVAKQLNISADTRRLVFAGDRPRPALARRKAQLELAQLKEDEKNAADLLSAINEEYWWQRAQALIKSDPTNVTMIKAYHHLAGVKWPSGVKWK